ncbi:MAG: hypothetical protein EP330_00350 [Deltaproteobacteria bacterium]|nr:MAG: hypothetical protein EP330_00350 [Deltaproteobacteria bacterium]
MRTLFSLAALLLCTPALAQDVGFVQEDVVAKRFPDAEVDGPSLVKGARVTVLVREEDRVRVRAGTTYGWVAASVIADTAPEGTAPPASFDSAALEALLKQAEASKMTDGTMSAPR